MEFNVRIFQCAPKVPLGELLQEADEINSKGLDLPFYGVNKDKEFMPTIATTKGLNSKKYKIIRKGKFVFSGMQTGRDKCIRFALYQNSEPVLLSPAYTLLEVKDTEKVLPEYIYLYFLSSERDRLGAFYSDASVRANLDLYRFFQIEIPLPSIDVQKQYVNAYRSLQKLAEQNEALAAPLKNACMSLVAQSAKKYNIVQLGSYIEPRDERNTNLEIKLSQGISNLKHFQNPKQVAANSKSDKIVRKGQFAYNRATTRNGEKISIAYRDGEDCTVSTAYQVFMIKDMSVLNPYFLLLWFSRPEFDRYARYKSEGSAHEFFDYSAMERVEIPLPPIEVQRSIVALYNCAEEARAIAREAREQLKKMAPAMVQRAANTPQEV